LKFFKKKLVAFEKVTIHLRPLSKEGTFIETRLTTGKRKASARRFSQLEKKPQKRLWHEYFELSLRPLSREVLYRMRREKLLAGSPQKVLKGLANSLTFVARF
jgi:hypothetical protein